MLTNEIITAGNKLIAVFMGYKYSYKCDIWRSGYCLKNVDLLSTDVFISKEQVLKEKLTINTESRPFFDENAIQISKYGEKTFYPNVVFFSTDSTSIPTTLSYNERFQKYHSSWDWLMPVIKKIHELDISIDNEVGSARQYNVVGSSIGPVTIESAWQACVEFITWYNATKH